MGTRFHNSNQPRQVWWRCKLQTHGARIQVLPSQRVHPIANSVSLLANRSSTCRRKVESRLDKLAQKSAQLSCTASHRRHQSSALASKAERLLCDKTEPPLEIFLWTVSLIRQTSCMANRRRCHSSATASNRSGAGSGGGGASSPSSSSSAFVAASPPLSDDTSEESDTSDECRLPPCAEGLKAGVSGSGRRRTSSITERGASIMQTDCCERRVQCTLHFATSRFVFHETGHAGRCHTRGVAETCEQSGK